jgi:hypothetical protein
MAHDDDPIISKGTSAPTLRLASTPSHLSVKIENELAAGEKIELFDCRHSG